MPNINMDINVQDLATSLATATPSARVVLSFQSPGLLSARRTLDAAMAVLPLDSLMLLTVDDDTRLSKQCWLHHAQRWPMLLSVRLMPHAVRGFREMLLLQDDNGGSKCPLLPSLTKLVLVYSALSECRTKGVVGLESRTASWGVGGGSRSWKKKILTWALEQASIFAGIV